MDGKTCASNERVIDTPIALHETAKDGTLKKGDVVVTIGYGGGFS